MLSGLYATPKETRNEGVIRLDHLAIMPTLHGFKQDGVDIHFNKYHNVCVASLGLCGKLTSLVGKNSFTHVINCGEDIAYLLALEGNHIGKFELLMLKFCGLYILA